MTMTNANANTTTSEMLNAAPRGLMPDEVHRLVGHLYCEVILLQREKADLQRQLAEGRRES